MACRIPILRFEQYCGTEATIGFVLRILATFKRFFSFLLLTSSSRTCACTLKISRISVFPLLFCFQLIHHQILYFSSIQCCPDLHRRFRFRSVFSICITDSRTLNFLGTNTNSQSSLIGLHHWSNVSLLQQNPTCHEQTNSHLMNQTPSFV